MAKKEAEAVVVAEPAKNTRTGFIVTFTGEMFPATVDDAGNIVGWNESIHAHFSFDEDRAKLAAAHRKGVSTV